MDIVVRYEVTGCEDKVMGCGTVVMKCSLTVVMNNMETFGERSWR